MAAGARIRKIFLDPASVQPHPSALEAIADADIILIGPGSVFTSVIPNLLVPGIAEALKASSVPKVYICNVMTQPGESDSLTASEHVTAVLNSVEMKIFDYVLMNSAAPSESAIGNLPGIGPTLGRARHRSHPRHGTQSNRGQFHERDGRCPPRSYAGCPPVDEAGFEVAASAIWYRFRLCRKLDVYSS